MKNKLCYLCGAMSGLTVEEYSTWRKYVQQSLEDIHPEWKCFNPADHFNFEDVDKGIITDKQAMDIDLYHLRRSDIVLYCSNDGGKSLGSMAEIAIAYDHNIPIICANLNTDVQKLHPWIETMCNKIFVNLDDAIQYIVEHYFI